MGVALVLALGVSGPAFAAEAWSVLDRESVDALLASASAADIEASLAEIESLGPRAIGHPGLDRACEWLVHRMTNLGLRVLGTPTVLVDVPVDIGSSLSWPASGGETRSVPVHSMWPNFVVPPVVPADGLTAPVLYAGPGKLENFDGKDVRGALVLLDYASQDRWLNAASLGAGAVLFLPDRQASIGENMAKAASAPLQCPRFYINDDAAAAELLALAESGGSATLKGGMTWRRAEARNVVALLPANAPAAEPETIVLNVAYDAASIAPSAAEGGLSAGTVASALAQLKIISEQPRAHHLLVLFDGSRAMAGAGTRSFAAVMRDLNATRIQQGGATARDRALREWMAAVKPWMDARRDLLAAKAGRLRAAIEWISREGGDSVPFAYRDPTSPPRSAWFPQTDAWLWLQDEMREQVKRGQIAALMALRDAEREHGADAYAADDAVAEPVRALRRKVAYYRVVAAEDRPEGILHAMKTAPSESVEWLPEDGTPQGLTEGWRRDLADVEQQQRVLQESYALRAELETLNIRRHVAMDLSAGNSLMTLQRDAGIGGEDLYRGQAVMEWFFTIGPLVSQRSENLVQQANRLVGGPEAPFDFVDGVTFNASRVRTAGAAPALSVDNDICMAGLSPFRLATANDPRVRLLGPGDRIPRDEESLRALLMQTRTASLLLSALLRDPAMWPEPEQLRSRTVTVGGRAVVRDPRAGPFPRLPVPGALVTIPDAPTFAANAVVTRYSLADRHGEFRFDDMAGGATSAMEKDDSPTALKLAAFHVSPETGFLDIAPDQASLRDLMTSVDLRRSEVYRRVVCFRGSAFQLYGLSDPMLLAPPTALTAMAGKGGSLENVYLSPPDAQAVVAVVPPGSQVKFLSKLGSYGPRMFLLGDQSEDVAGNGYGIGAGTNFVGTSWAAAGDLHRLNAARLGKLESKGVRSSVAARLHRGAAERLKEMESAIASYQWSAAQFLARGAWGRDLRAYPRILEMANQAVLAAVILLGFLALASVFLERIAIQSGSIYGRMGGAVGIFSAGFIILYVLHPAFQVSQSPMIILIAYTIIVLALLAFSVIANKYAEVMKAWREKVGGIHASDISRAGAMSVAFNLGLTNLAKRPLRTTLTILTVALLAFSVMTFTSVETSLDTRYVPLPAARDGLPDSILFRLFKWVPIPTSTADSFEQDLGPGSVTARRTIKLNARKPWEIGLGVNRFVFTQPATGASYTGEALPGFAPNEGLFSRLPECVKGRWFSGRADEVILPTAAAAALGVAAADVVGKADDELPVIRYGETRLRVVGLLDSRKADALRDVSGASLAPVDFYVSGIFVSPNDTDLRNAVGEEPRVSFMSFDRVVLLPNELVNALGGEIYTVAGRLPPGGDTRAALDHLMSRIEVNLYASVGDRNYLIKTARSQSVQGAWKLLLPILLVVLIMVNVMMGTVDERREEIRMLGAVGLAPRHVSILFLAEACVYGVLGIVFGVFIGLVIAWLTRGASSGVDVNYASVSTMMMGVLVLGVVVLSTWIPAARAARLATPSGAAKWSLPPSADGRISIELPFRVTRENGLGVFAFLHEYLRGHRESTSPDFRCSELSAAIVAHGDRASAVEIGGQVWPAPYDRRVSQQMSFRLAPVEGSPMFRVEVACERLSGELDAWNRGVFEFLDLIRRQFLIFRTLSDEHKRRYVAEAKEMLR